MTDKILPDEPNAALEKMIMLVKECLALSISEDDKMTRNDMLQFAVTGESKEQAFSKYEAAAAEFTTRVDELRGKVDPSLITELQRLQLELREQADANNVRLEQIEGVMQKEG